MIKLFGGIDGLRDRTLLESAVFQPRNVYHYTKGDLFDVAAAYAIHLGQAQAFLDGNKRVGATAALLFLKGNEVPVPADSDRLYEAMVSVAERKASREDLAALLRQLAGGKAAP